MPGEGGRSQCIGHVEYYDEEGDRVRSLDIHVSVPDDYTEEEIIATIFDEAVYVLDEYKFADRGYVDVSVFISQESISWICED